MGAVAKILNVGRGEAILRSIIGVILIILAFLASGFSRWVFGLIGVLFIITAIFGY
jgi:Inner membrane protein YgaP-like, transmembrane domain